MEYVIMWAILAISLALLRSNQVERHRGIHEALTLVALVSAFVIFVSKLAAMLF